MSWWSKKKSDNCSNTTYTNAKEDPNLTRFHNRSCSKC